MNKNKVAAKVRKIEDIARNAAESEVYGQVLRAVGNRRFEVTCQIFGSSEQDTEAPTGQTIICALKGSYRKRINKDSYVLVKLYEFNQTQGMIIDSYTDEELAAMKRMKLWDFTLQNMPLMPQTAQVASLLSSDDSESEAEDEEEAVAEATEVPVDIDNI